jgi:serine/threonine protein kinase
VDQNTFLGQLRDNKLLSEEQLAEVSRRCATELPFHQLTAALVDQGWLTTYQVEQIWSGKAGRLSLGVYRIIEELGRGGFGRVFKAVHGIMNRVVALKVIAPELVEDARARTWFLREVLATTQLAHPNIALAYDANEIDDVLFLAMEFVDGPNLETLVRKQGPLPIGFACALLHQVSRALQYAHEKGMVHRDIKPANLLIPQGAAAASYADGSAFRAAVNGAVTPLVKIVDFGLARLHEKGTGNTLTNNKGFMGTPDYVSPEQARSIHDVDIRSDLYSLGCTFYFVLTGRPPFKGKAPLEIILQHLEKEPPPLESLRPEAPPALVSIVRRLMSKKPEQRFQTPADLAAELGFLVGSSPMIALPPPAAAAGMNGFADMVGSGLHRMSRATGSRPVVPIPPLDRNAPGRDVPSEDDLAESLPRTACLPEWDPPKQCCDANPKSAQTVDYVTQGVRHSNGAEHAILPEVSPVASNAPLDASFLERWRQWAGVIEDLARSKPTRVAERDYRWLHASLLEVCKQRQTDKFCERLQNLIAPWLSLQTLAATDRETLASLWSRCQEINRELGLRKKSWLVPAAMLLFVVAVAVGVLLTQSTPVTRSLPSLAGAWRYLQDNPFLAVAGAAPLVVLGTLFGVGRFFRS